MRAATLERGDVAAAGRIIETFFSHEENEYITTKRYDIDLRRAALS